MPKDQPSGPCAEHLNSPQEKPEREARLRDHVESQVRVHKDQFVQPTPEFVKEKSEVFQIDRGSIEKRPAIFMCPPSVPHKVVFHPTKRFDPSIYEVEPYLHQVSPKSLNHLKQLAGVPNEVHVHSQKQSGGCCSHGLRLRAVQMHHLPTEETIHFNRLSAEQRAAVQDLSFNLLMGYADSTVAEKPPYKAIVDYVIGRVVALPVFVGKDLLVCPDQTVEFSGFAAVYFDNVVVVGNGRILLGNHTKLHAYQIKHN